jgi:hypothetical protein
MRHSAPGTSSARIERIFQVDASESADDDGLSADDWHSK